MQQDKLWNANYWKVMVANFTMAFSGYLLTPLLPLYLSEQFGATKDTIGLVLAGYIVAALLVRPFSGYLADSFPRKKVLLLALALNAIIFGGYLVAGTLLLFFIVRTLHGGPFGASSVANSTVAIDVLPSSRRTEGIGYYGLSNNLGTAIAPTIGVYVYTQTHSFQFLFLLALAVALVGFVVDATIKLPERQLMQDKKKLSLDRFFLLRGWLVGLNVAVFGLCYGVLSNYLAIYSKETLGITTGTGTYFAILSGGLMLSRIQGGRALRQGRVVHNAAEGIIISTVGYLLFATVHHPVGYYGSALLIGLGNGHMWPSMQNMIVDLAEHNERGTANSTILTGWDLGLGLGILLGGIVAEHVGYIEAFVAVAIVHAIGVALFFAATRKHFLANRLR
ncbi:MAG: MFS transporter [Bacteroidales bacterium]|nr:MFS transporter [Bacteroidales bacterium]